MTSPESATSISSHRLIIALDEPEALSWQSLAPEIKGADFTEGARIFPEEIKLNEAVFDIEITREFSIIVSVLQEANQLILLCDCGKEGSKACSYQIQILNALCKQKELQVFFNRAVRNEKLRTAAMNYGLEAESDLDQHFKIALDSGRLFIEPVKQEFIPVTRESIYRLTQQIKPEDSNITTDSIPESRFMVFRQHKFYHHLIVELYHGQRTEKGKLKNPLLLIDAQKYLWKSQDPAKMKFFMALSRFQNRTEDLLAEEDILALKSIIENPLQYPVYFHQPEKSENIITSALKPVKIALLAEEPVVKVSKSEKAYEVSIAVKVGEKSYSLSEIAVRYKYFLQIEEALYLMTNLQLIRTIQELFEQKSSLLISHSKFNAFKEGLLNQIEDKVHIDYQYIPQGTPKQIAWGSYDTDRERIIYLSDFGSHVMIIPVMRYSDMEIAVRSKRQVYGTDQKGKAFMVKRDAVEEDKLVSLLIKQHPDFEEQLNDPLEYFYLHKRYFLDEDWFLNTFEEWGSHQIRVLGFNEIRNNRFNPNKIKVDIKVLSGINWFNAEVDVKFGKQKASLKKIHLAVKNKRKYVLLDDGTQGIIPAEWIEKFKRYFIAADISDDDHLTLQKVNFSQVEELFEEEMLDNSVKRELAMYREKAEDFTKIQQVKVPAGLNGKLRGYQREGLNWLNFLDDFNFGGVLADDMGLGKSVQIIAFMLLQKQKRGANTNLLVVPTTLIFNWEAEIEKFAPKLKVFTLKGPERSRETTHYQNYDIILTSYTTLLTDVNFLKSYIFNYIFLDESQQIKNPESQRYKAVKLLQSRNKIAITGTPVENNTFDLYSQFSFACPGLLGTKRYFKNIYSAPIDQFKDSKRAQDLQQKIRPFLLRRTKGEVAKELPEKTETILYCEMQEQQRAIYDAYEKEFREYVSAKDEEELDKNRMNVLRGLTKLRQICNSTKLLNDGTFTEEHPSAKIDALLEQIEDNTPHHKILVFSQFVSMLDLIEAELKKKNIGYVKLTGRTRNREEIVAEFQQQQNIRVFLISLKAGGTGLNLEQANYVYLVDPWWNPAVENQAIDRVHRIGQRRNVTAVRMICPDTVEEKIMQLQATKKELAGELIVEDASFLKSMSKKELLSFLS
ncbi:DNA helicase [Marivirga lumbricoides]|uniref:DNA helicase n=1 Tax=Marivirga lumbricoides TaxID=1046115 RepID=A0A2T4DQW1_9BACT|nr:DNA helicase [Marivirga lumbricoides]